MFFKRFFFFGLLALLIFALLGGRARTRFAEGYTQGYAAGLQAASPQAGETAGEAPVARPPESARIERGWHGWGLFPFFGFFALLCPVFLLFFASSLIFGRRRRWRGHHWCGGHGPGGGWPGHKHTRPEKQPEDVEPDIRQV